MKVGEAKDILKLIRDHIETPIPEITRTGLAITALTAGIDALEDVENKEYRSDAGDTSALNRQLTGGETMCNCMREIEKRLEEHEDIEYAKTPIDLKSGRPYLKVKVRKKGEKRKRKMKLLLNRCPFCGEPYPERK